jgi:serine/threonine-protein kinase
MAAKPCHAVGSAIRATGRLAAPPGTRATVSLRLQNAATGRPVGGTRHCGTLVFTDESLTQSCGPVEFSAPHGQRYVVVQTWRLTREGKAAQGTAQGAEFTW